MNLSEDILKEGVLKFIDAAAASDIGLAPTDGGVNNVVKKVQIEGRGDYILRVYNNGQNSAKVIFEHLVLQELQKVPMSFEIPVALSSIRNSQTHEILMDGTEVSLFRLIPGALPGLTCVFEIGKACGELTKALASISIEFAPQTAPYYDIYKAHHAISRDLFFQEMNSNIFDEVRESANIALSEIRHIEDVIYRLKGLNLPQQLIHGDLHYDNILAKNCAVTGVVDFEFCAMDWRAMDLAITLSKYASELEPLAFFQQVICGYSQFIALTEDEIDSVVDLIILRILSNIVFFVGRAIAGEDSVRMAISKLNVYLKRIVWLRKNRLEILKCFDVKRELL